MLIERVTLIQFDEVADRARISRTCPGVKGEVLLAIMDAFIAADFAQMYRLARAADPKLLGYLAMPVSDILHEVHDRVVKQAAAARGLKLSKVDQKKLAQRGIPFGPEALNYPKFYVNPQGDAPLPATMPQLTDA